MASRSGIVKSAGGQTVSSDLPGQGEELGVVRTTHGGRNVHTRLIERDPPGVMVILVVRVALLNNLRHNTPRQPRYALAVQGVCAVLEVSGNVVRGVSVPVDAELLDVYMLVVLSREALPPLDRLFKSLFVVGTRVCVDLHSQRRTGLEKDLLANTSRSAHR